MAKNLEPDYINWVLTLNASQAQEEIHKLEKANKEWKASNQATRKAMAELEAQGKKNSAEYRNLQRGLRENNREIALNEKRIRSLSERLDTSSMTVRQLRQRMKELKREFENTSRATDPERYERLRRSIDETGLAIRRATSGSTGLRSSFLSLSKMKNVLQGFFLGIGSSILMLVTGSFRQAFQIVVDFERANARLASILGTTADGVRKLTAAARRLGATTSYSAAQVTGLQIELAKLGFAEPQILAMEAAVLKFAKAVDTDLARASAFAGAALRIFGKDASETEDVLATFAISTARSALDFSKLESSLATVGPVAHSFGLSLEDTTALLGVLANAGFDASSAATATRNILLKLCDANGDLAKALGGPVRNADDLAKGLNKLRSEGVDLARALELTDKRSVSAFSNFIDNADTLVELRDSITDVNDGFNQMSATMGATVAGAMAGLRSASEELVLSLSQGTNGPIRDLINLLTSVVQGIGRVINWLGQYSAAVKAVAVSLATYKGVMLLTAAATKAWAAVTAVAKGLAAAYHASVLALQKGMAAMRVTTLSATAATRSLGAAMKATPWGLVAAAVLALGAAVVTYCRNMREATAVTKAKAEADRTATENYSRQRAAVEALVMQARNENTAMADRLAAVRRLNRIIPGYNARIDETTGKYRASTKALRDYLANLEKKMRYEANAEKLQELIRKEEESRRTYSDTEQTEVERIKGYRAGQRRLAAAKKADRGDRGNRPVSASRANNPSAVYTGDRDPYESLVIQSGRRRAAARQQWERDRDDVREFMAWMQKGLETGTMAATAAADAVEEVEDAVTGAAGKAGKAAKKAEKDLSGMAGAVGLGAKAVNDALVAADRETHEKRMEGFRTFYDTQEREMQRAVNEERTTREAADLYLLDLERKSYAGRLDELRRYRKEVEDSDRMDAAAKKKALEGLDAEISAMQSRQLTAAGKWMERIRELSADTSAAGLLAGIDAEIRSMEILYGNAVELARANGQDVTALEEEKARRIAALNYRRREQEFQTMELTGLSWADEYDRELARLEALHEQELVSERDYQRKRLELQVRNVQRYFEYYARLSGSMFSAIQDAEIAMSEAKYDALIRQAENNGEETAALEQDKENEKLEIQKRYADVNFAIKAGTIIADTAVSIMKGFADLGPVAGAIAAAMLTATGVAQLMQANAEREKIKNLQPASSAGSSSASAISSPATATRMLTGYSEGGYTGPGTRYEVAGLVHRGEYVVPMPIMDHPAVSGAVEMIEAIRLGRRGLPEPSRPAPASGPGFAEGGYTGSPFSGADSGAAAATAADLTDAVRELRAALACIRAYVVLKDIDDARGLRDRSRLPFTRNH